MPVAAMVAENYVPRLEMEKDAHRVGFLAQIGVRGAE